MLALASRCEYSAAASGVPAEHDKRDAELAHGPSEQLCRGETNGSGRSFRKRSAQHRGSGRTNVTPPPRNARRFVRVV